MPFLTYLVYNGKFDKLSTNVTIQLH